MLLIFIGSRRERNPPINKKQFYFSKISLQYFKGELWCSVRFLPYDMLQVQILETIYSLVG